MSRTVLPLALVLVLVLALPVFGGAALAQPVRPVSGDVEDRVELLDACLDQTREAAGDPFDCVGRLARRCGDPTSPACLDRETETWDALSAERAAALSDGRATDESLVDEAARDVLAHRRAQCDALAEGDRARAAACRRAKAAERAIVFDMLLSLEAPRR